MTNNHGKKCLFTQLFINFNNYFFLSFVIIFYRQLKNSQLTSLLPFALEANNCHLNSINIIGMTQQKFY